MGELRVLDDLRVLDALAVLAGEEDLETRALSLVAALKTLERNSQTVICARPTARQCLEEIADFMADGSVPPSMRQLLVDAVGGPGSFPSRSSRTQESLAGVLVGLLDAPCGPLRAAAAGALSRLGIKRTIVNPTFWQRSPPLERRREIAEWRRWLAERS
jgi:hypothetical protein